MNTSSAEVDFSGNGNARVNVSNDGSTIWGSPGLAIAPQSDNAYEKNKITTHQENVHEMGRLDRHGQACR